MLDKKLAARSQILRSKKNSGRSRGKQVLLGMMAFSMSALLAGMPAFPVLAQENVLAESMTAQANANAEGIASLSENVQCEETSAAVTFTDDLGREITVEHPQNVIPTIGSYTKIWMLAGGEESIVACSNDSWEEFHLDLPETVINLGKTKELNMELLAAAEPDLILASSNTQAGLSRLDVYDGMGLTSAFFTVNNFQDYLRMLKICTEITGREDRYEQYGAQVEAQVEEALAKNDGSAPKVLYVRISGNGISAKSSKGNILGEMLADLGADNIADRDDALLEDLNMEVILQEDPQYVFVVKQIGDPKKIGQMYEELLHEDPAWGSLSAVQEGRIYLMDADLYNLKPCERWGEAYLNLAEILYEKD